MPIVNNDFRKKIDKTKKLLSDLSFPEAQNNDLTAWAILALLDNTQRQTKSGFNSFREGASIRDILDYCRENGTIYAENTRESLRKYSIKYLVNTGIAIRNHDDPGRATNSSRTNYILHPSFIDLIEAQENIQKGLIEKWLSNKGTRASESNWRTDKSLIVNLGSSIVEVHPSPHNFLEKTAVEEFLPVFTKNCKIIYFSDTDNKSLYIDPCLDDLTGKPFDVHQKLPDVVAIDQKLKAIFFIEAVASAGEVNELRKLEIDSLFVNTSHYRKRYVSVFLNRKDFRKFSEYIAVGTEAWIVEDYPQIVYFKALSTLSESSLDNP